MPEQNNQEQYFDNQDIKFDINEFYTNWISQIDMYRSTFDAISTTTLDNFTQANIDKALSSLPTSNQDLKESRCHAFYRMIGLPVVGDDGSFYSPGFDKEATLDQNVQDSKFSIANKYDKQVKELINRREKFNIKFDNIFNKKDNNATAMALSSIYLRPFDNITSSGTLEIDQQKYDVTSRKFITNILMKDLPNAPTVNVVSNSHIIKPFIVDPRIEMTVLPSRNRITIPFLLSKSESKMRSDLYLNRPLIEQVARVRFHNRNRVDEQGDFIKNLTNTIKNSPNITDKELVENLTNINNINKYYRSELKVYENLFRIMRALMKFLFDNIRSVIKNSSAIRWLPVPNERGPEFGLTLNEIYRDDTLNTKLEKNIISLELRERLERIEFDIIVNNKDAGNFVFNGIDDIVFGGIKNVSKILQPQIDKLKKRRQATGDSLNQSLKNIEIVMGEFSGLGLIDIIAIYSAFWMIDQKTLYSLLDDRARARLGNIKELQNPTVAAKEVDGILVALNKFEKKVKENYAIMNSVFSSFGSIKK